ncbi:thioredoxin family protein [Falsibacillus pallidus]|uniref:thioredoxin family protein n=1 Tax=Falsibacillus pallidus TaxID=493781 RepID=UPI003D9554D5
MEQWGKEDIKAKLSGGDSFFLYFYTPLCGTCQVAGRMLEVTEAMMPEQAFGKADLNYMPELAETFAIESVPCLIAVQQGVEKEKMYAFQSVPHVYQFMQKWK